MGPWQIVSIVVCILCLSVSCSPQSKQRPETDADVPDVINQGESIKVNVVKESLFCNVREYVRGNVSFAARPIEKGNNYRILRIGTPKNPYANVPALRLRFPDGTVLDTSTIDLVRLRAMASSDELAREPLYNRNTKRYDKWPNGSRRLTIGPWVFILHQDQIVFFSVYYRQDNQWQWSGYIPSIGISGTEEMSAFPLKQTEVLRIFGKPDVIRESLQE